MKSAKRFVSVLLMLCMLLGMLPGTALAANTVCELPFTDIDTDDWFYDAVEYVYGKGLMIGTEEYTFSPQTVTTRGMVVTILHQMENKPSAVSADFSDVDDSAWYAAAVNWAASAGIVSGYGNGFFGPDDPITREQMAVILHSYVQHKGYDISVGENTNILSYHDFNLLSEWAIPAMQWACGAGLISGVGGGSLLPRVMLPVPRQPLF